MPNCFKMELSPQALSILREFANSGQKTFHVSETGEGLRLSVCIKVTEPGLLNDDLNTLVERGLLSRNYNFEGFPYFAITENGMRLAKVPFSAT